jgi:hypothetical protein
VKESLSRWKDATNVSPQVSQSAIKGQVVDLGYDYDDIIVEINGNKLTQQDFEYIQQLSEILDSSDLLNEFTQPGEQFELGNLKITIMNVQTYEKDLIVCKK